jgi:phage gp36-like protein
VAVYATQADVELQIGAKVLASFADDDGNGVTDPSAVLRGLSAASSIAEGYFASSNPLPLATVPDALRLAVINVYVGQARRDRNQATKDSELAFESAMKWLRDIAAGTVQLFPPVPDVVDPGDPEIVAQERAWTRSTGFGVF